jgi:hypothetical protein
MGVWEYGSMGVLGVWRIIPLERGLDGVSHSKTICNGRS